MSAKPENDIKKLTAEDVRGAWLAGKLSQRRFDLVTATRKLSPAETKEKLSALAQVALWKSRVAKKANAKHYTGFEKSRRHKEKAASIDKQLDEAFKRVNWKRRRAAETSLVEWMKTYCAEAGSGFIDDEPSSRLAEALLEMQAGIGDASIPYHIRLARGFGKTSFAEGAVAYAAATGLRKYIVIVSAKADDAANLLDDVFNLFENGKIFAQDYPEVALPIALLAGGWRRRQFYKGTPTAFVKGHDRIVLPSVTNGDGVLLPSSGAILAARGVSGKVRGMKRGALRPDLLVLDDLQDEKEALNPETIAKNARKIRRTFLNLGGKKKLACIMTSTPIEPDDLSETFAKDPAWKTTTFKAFEKWPHEWEKNGDEGLWGDYIRIYRHELNAGSRAPHKRATAFYLANQQAMDDGAEVLNPNRYDPAVQVSGVQALMDKYFEIGPEAFDAEMQMKPRKHVYAFEISAKMILARVASGTRCGEIPAGTVFTCAATDINPSYAISTAIVCFKADRTAFVSAYALTRCHIDDRENDTLFHQQIYSALVAHGQALHDLGIPLDAWGIDANGKQIAPVTALGQQNESLCGVRAVPLIGRPWAKWSDKPRTARYPAINDVVCCHDPLKGRQWFFFNADRYKEEAQRAWGTETGATGGLSLFDGGVEHDDFALQIANEKLITKRKMLDGRFDCQWKTREPHDFGDCMAMAYAMAAGLRNITGETLPAGAFSAIAQAERRRAENDDGIFPNGCVEI